MGQLLDTRRQPEPISAGRKVPRKRGLKMQLDKKSINQLDVKPEVLEALRKNAAEDEIACAAARRLAEELGVSPAEVGRACDLLKIKIKFCALGCFN